MSLRMTKAEREEFLAGLHVGIISIAEPGRGPLAVPIWYGYEPGGELWISMLVKMRPEHWLSVDYAKEFSSEGGSSA